jgi:hypothetical protein
MHGGVSEMLVARMLPISANAPPATPEWLVILLRSRSRPVRRELKIATSTER